MTTLSSDNTLQQHINGAWQEIQTDPHHRLQVNTRLTLYDLLVRDVGMMREFGENVHIRFFPQVTPGLKRYWYLGLQTIMPLLPVWEREMNRWLRSNPDYEPDRSFPFIIVDATQDLLQGKTYDEVDTLLPQKTEYWTGMSSWHYVVGNMTDDLPYTARMCLHAIYNVHRAVCGLPPIGSRFSDGAYDEDLSPYSNRDWTYYAFEAVMSAATSIGDEQQFDTRPTKRDPHKALDFWYWWLFEVVPSAATVNLDTLGWQITQPWYSKSAT